MFAPDERAVLREALRPDVGETLVHAVGTTFSLDLAAALAVPLAFAAHGLHEASDPVSVLEAVRAAADQVDVFCQCGSINAPSAPSDLAAFLEPMLHEVRAPMHQEGFLFHPKVWVVRYDADGEDRFRLICSTRNLTDSAAWDAVVRLDGRPEGKRTDIANRPLMDLVRALPAMAVRQMEPGRQDRIERMADSLGPVAWQAPADLGNVAMAFHALGLRRARNRPEIVAGLQGRRHLVVSPFVDDDGINEITEGSGEVIVVSRADNLDRLDVGTVERLDCRVVSSLAGLSSVADDEAPADQAREQGILGGLHAKMYVVEAANQAALYIGSANATSAGLFGRNVEFVVEFRGGRKALGIDRFLDPDTGLGSLLEDYPAQGGQQRDAADELRRMLDRTLRALAAATFTSTITETEGSYTQTVRIDPPLGPLEPGTAVQIAVYGNVGEAQPIHAGDHSWTFANLRITDVSAFVVVTAVAGDDAGAIRRSTLVRTELIGDPGSRRDEILAKQFETPDQFLRFLALLLGIHHAWLPASAGTGEFSGGSGWGGGPGLFEMLVNAAATRPGGLEDLARLVDRLQQTERGRSVLPEGFARLWASVSEASRRLGRDR